MKMCFNNDKQGHTFSMKKVTIQKGTYLALVLLLGSLNSSFAKTDITSTLPTCSSTGTLSCPNGFKPDCPEKYKPSCVFLGSKQRPACLANYTDTTFYSYSLDKIVCKKGK